MLVPTIFCVVAIYFEENFPRASLGPQTENLPLITSNRCYSGGVFSRKLFVNENLRDPYSAVQRNVDFLVVDNPNINNNIKTQTVFFQAMEVGLSSK
jgi:hypothetical protein